MPRAPKKCPKVECHNRQPCPVHPMGWGAKKPGSEMPSDWNKLRRRVWARDVVCVLCRAPGHSVDHVIPRSRGGGHSLDNLRLLCHDCHKKKSDEEKNFWRKRNGKNQEGRS